MIHTRSYYLKAAKTLRLKHPRKFARKMVEKQFAKALPHGHITRFEHALRGGKAAF